MQTWNLFLKSNKFVVHIQGPQTYDRSLEICEDNKFMCMEMKILSFAEAWYLRKLGTFETSS